MSYNSVLVKHQKVVGRRLQHLRKKLGVSQTELARRLGVTPAAVAAWEQGVREPDAMNSLRLARLGSGEDAGFFWRRAGLQPGDIEQAGRKEPVVHESIQESLARLEELIANGFARLETILASRDAKPEASGIRIRKAIRVRGQPHEERE